MSTYEAIICRNLKMLFDSRSGLRADFARCHYMSQSTVTKWTQGIAGDISLCNAWRVAVYFGVPLDWLVADHRKAYAMNTTRQNDAKIPCQVP